MNKITNSGHEVTVVVPVWTIGLDLGDRTSRACVMDGEGKMNHEESLRTTSSALLRFFSGYRGARVALEVGTHSPWVSRLLQGLGLEVIVANARKVRLIGQNERKSDRMDAELLARLARVDPELLYPIQHRGAAAQADLALLHARDALVRNRTRLINHVRGAVKSLGERLPACSAPAFARRAASHLPEALRPALEPLLPAMGYGSAQIRELEATLNAVDADLVLCATPIDLTRVLTLNKPMTRVRYDLAEAGGTPLAELIEPIVRMTRTPVPAGAGS